MRWFALVLSLLLPLVASAADGWLDELEIPLMEGLAAAEDGETVFETSAGRIVEIETSGAVAPDAVRRYYATALAGLGWQADAAGGFVRDGERLQIEITGDGARTVVAFRLTPQ